MEIVLEIVTPVFALMALGYIAARIGWFPPELATGLAKFVFNFVIPCFLFKTFATSVLPDSIPWDFFGSYYISLITVYVLGLYIARMVYGRDWMGAIISGFTAGFGNTVLLGIPLVLRAFGEDGAIPVFLLISIHGLLVMTSTTIFLEIARSSETEGGSILVKIAKGLITNPLIGGLALGLAFNFTGLSIPKMANDFLNLMSGAVVPCALFAMGNSLAQYGFKGRLGQSSINLALKCMLFPAMTYALATYVFEVEPLWVMVAVLIAAMPSGVNAYLFANRYQTGEAMTSSSIVISTLFSVLSLSVILYLFNASP